MSEHQLPKTYLPAGVTFEAAALKAADSRFYPLERGTINPEQAFQKLMHGRDLGITASAALTGIHVVKGKLQISGDLLRSLVQEHPRFDFRFRERSDEAAEIEFFEIVGGKRDSLGSVRFTMDDARRADLLKNNVWQKYPRAMLAARATSEGVRAYCPSVTMGAPVYVEGELDDTPEPPRQVQVQQVRTVVNEPPRDPRPDVPAPEAVEPPPIVNAILGQAEQLDPVTNQAICDSLAICEANGWPSAELDRMLRKAEAAVDAAKGKASPEAVTTVDEGEALDATGVVS